MLAADQPSPDVEMARAFFGICVQNAGRSDKISAYAKAFDYEELSADLKLALGPQDPGSDYNGWKVEEPSGLRYLLGVSEAEMKGRAYVACSLANPDIEMDGWLEQIEAIAPTDGILDDYTEAGQRIRWWKFPAAAPGAVITAMDAPLLGVTGGTVTLLSPITE